MSDQLAITLTPNSFDERPRSFTMGQRQWQTAVRLVDRAGFRPNTHAGLDKRDVGPFASYLRQALATGSVPADDRAELTRLANYLEKDGANVRGLSLSRGFKRWDR